MNEVRGNESSRKKKNKYRKIPRKGKYFIGATDSVNIFGLWTFRKFLFFSAICVFFLWGRWLAFCNLKVFYFNFDIHIMLTKGHITGPTSTI